MNGAVAHPRIDDLTLAMAVAREAGAVLMEHFEGPLTVETKSSAVDLVTVADRVAEARILERIRTARPEDGILAEESGAIRQGGHDGGRRWIVDPLDGTTNFAHTFPHFSVSIALYEGGTGQVGVVYDPCRDEIFYTRVGHGAWLRSSRHPRLRLQVTEVDTLGRSLLATGFGYNREAGDNVAEFGRLVRQVRGIRRPGSAALDLAYVAAGRIDGFWEYHLSPWDWGAGVILVREAGGQVSTMQGDPWNLNAPSVCAAGSRLMPQLIQALAS